MAKRGDDFARGYVPQRGDIVHLNWDPSVGHEMNGPHYGLVLSQNIFNVGTGFILVSPITSKQGKLSGFEFPVQAGRVQGVVVLSEVRTIDYQNRNIQFEGVVQPELVEEACRRVKMVL
ncbi:MAG: type II toxin-antitoxin system PemK/MazF family toxin [Rhodospirillaceae bacterium]